MTGCGEHGCLATRHELGVDTFLFVVRQKELASLTRTMLGTGGVLLYKFEQINFPYTPPISLGCTRTMSTIIQLISASVLPRRLRRWVSTRPQSFIPGKFLPFGNIVETTCLNQPTTEIRTRVVGELWPQIQERGFNPGIHSTLNFHRGISRIPTIQREAVHPNVSLIPPNFYASVEGSENAKPSANSGRLATEPNNALGLSCYNPQHCFMDVESNANSRPTTIEPNNALGLFFDTPPSSRIPNVESLSTTVSSLGFLTPRNEAHTEETLFFFEPLGSDLNFIRQNSQTPSANSSQPFLEPNNALGLWLYDPHHHILDVQSSNSRPTIEPNNALGLSLGHPSICIESLPTSPPVPLGFHDDGYPELPSFEQLNANFDFYGEDLQIGANLRKLTIQPNNFPQTQPESSSHIPQDIRWGDVGMWDIARRKLIPNPTPWEIEIPPPGPLRTNFNPFWDLSNIDSNSGFSYEPAVSYLNSSNDGTFGERPPKSQELSVTFGGKIGRQVRWQDIMPSVDHFIECCTNHSLAVVLEPSGSTYDQWERRQTLKKLFDRLKLTEPVATCTDRRRGWNVAFNRISITVPSKGEDKDMMLVALPWNNSSGRTIPDDNWEKIDITSASNLREFLWNGPFQQLSENFLYPADGLTLLSITGCQISVNDAVELLRPCSSLEEVRLETVHETNAVASTPRSGSKFKFSLKKLSVTSSVDLTSVLKRIAWAPESELTVIFLNNGAQDANALSCAEVIPRNIGLRLKGNFLQRTMDKIQARR